MKTKLRIIYGLLNYVLAALFLAMPFINGNEQSITAHIVTSFSGAFILVVTLLTNFELGVLRVISLREYLFFGLIAGGFLLVSPFIFGFYPYGFILHLVAGITLSTSSAFIHRSIFVNRHRTMMSA
jgi:hypothetical protein